MPYNFPLIVVERPHQGPGRSWVAHHEANIIGTAWECEDDYIVDHYPAEHHLTVDEALDALGHDLRAINVIEDGDAIPTGHNVPVDSIRRDMETLGWIAKQD